MPEKNFIVLRQIEILDLAEPDHIGKENGADFLILL